MSRSKHKSFSRHESEKCKKKSRMHRIKYEKGRIELDIAEKNANKCLWSKWLNFIRGHWCGQIKNETNSLDIYTRALSADVFDIPVERKCTVFGTKMTIPKHCRRGSAFLNNNSYCVSENIENPHKKEDGRLMQYSDSYNKAIMGKNFLNPELYFSENADKVIGNAKCVTPRLGYLDRKNWNGWNRRVIQNGTNQNHIPEHSSIQNFCSITSKPMWSEKAEINERRKVKAGIDNLLDQLICLKQDATNNEKPTEKPSIEFNIEDSMKESKISRQVSPAILVNIKPFKNHVSQSNLQGNKELGKLNLNQTKKTKMIGGDLGSQHVEKHIGKQDGNPQLRCTALKNQVLTLKNIWDAGKEKAVLTKKTRTENPVVEPNKDFYFDVAMHRNHNKPNGESGDKNFEARVHNFVFKKNLRQFRKKINNETIKGEEKETEINEMKSENKPEENIIRREKLEVEKIQTVFTTSEVMLGTYYNLATKYSVVGIVFVRGEIHTAIMSQIVREINEFHERHIKTLIQKRSSDAAKEFLIREIREIPMDKLKKARILHEVKYCMRNVKTVAKVIFSPKRATSDFFFVSREYSTPKEPEEVESEEHVTDLLSFLQEYSELVEKSYSGDDLIDTEKILATVAKTFLETDVESDCSSINTNVLVEDLTKDHRVVQILNSSALEYLALIYHSLRPRNCSGKSFSEADLHKKRRQAIPLSSDCNIMKDLDSRMFRQRISSPNSDVSQILYYDMESISDEAEDQGLETGNMLYPKANDSIPSIGRKKMQMFKSNSFPGEIALVRDYRSQKSRLSKDLRKALEKRRKFTEEEVDMSKMNNLGLEKPVKIEIDGAKISKFQKYLISEHLKNTNENGNKKIFFMEKKSGELKKEVIAAFSTIKDLTEEKNNSKTSVVIMLSKK